MVTPGVSPGGVTAIPASLSASRDTRVAAFALAGGVSAGNLPYGRARSALVDLTGEPQRLPRPRRDHADAARGRRGDGAVPRGHVRQPDGRPRGRPRGQDGARGGPREVAEMLGAAPGEVVFTAGGTEADNLAVKGAARAAAPPARRRRRHHRVRAQGRPGLVRPPGPRDSGSSGRRRSTRRRRRRCARRRRRRPYGAGVGDAGQQRGRHHPAARRDRRGCASARRGARAHRRGAGGAVARRRLGAAAAADLVAISAHKFGVPRAPARWWCAAAWRSNR